MKLKVVLQLLNGENITMEKDSDEISKHAILTYKGLYFLYRGYIGNNYSEVAFCEVLPPHELLNN